MQMKQVAPKTAGPELFDPTRCNCLALRQAARHVSQIYDRHLAKVGLRGTQYSILSKLSRLGALPIGRLAEALVLDRTALGRALRPLERARLVAVGAGPDGRTRSVRLTAAGKRVSSKPWSSGARRKKNSKAASARTPRRRCGPRCCASSKPRKKPTLRCPYSLCGAGYAVFPFRVPRKPRGWRAKRRVMQSCARAVSGTWRLSARHRGDSLRAGSALPATRPSGQSRVQQAPCGRRPSAPRRSGPGSASRVRGCVHPPPAGAASDPTFMTPHDSALGGSDAVEYNPILCRVNNSAPAGGDNLAPSQKADSAAGIAYNAAIH